MTKKQTNIVIAASVAFALIIIISIALLIAGSNDSSGTKVPVVSPSNDVTTSVPESSAPTSTVPSTSAQANLASAIVGKWMDSANMSGYEFFADGTVDVTYVNLTIPVLNIPINGSAKGTYTIDGDTLTTSYSIYSKTITDKFTATIDGTSLKLVGSDKNGTYAKVSSSTSDVTTTIYPSVGYKDDELTGPWVNADASVKYNFTDDGTVQITQNGSSFNGVYMIQGDSVTIQYSALGEIKTEKYTYTVSMNSMSLTNEKGNVTIWVRSGTGSAPTSAPEKLLGKWTDGANMSGFEFREGGIVDVTYVNITIPVINMPINGTYTGVYAISDDGILTMNYSIYNKSISNSYTFSVQDNTLVLTNVENGEVSTYLK